MKTSSFFNYTGPGRVSIARYAPRGTPAGFRTFRKLAPKQDMLKMGYDDYRVKYFGEILKPLDPAEVYDHLIAVAYPHEPVLLCWERLIKDGEWCHRRMVAEWLEKALGIEVLELPRPQRSTNKPG